MNNSDRLPSCLTRRDVMFRVMAYGAILVVACLFLAPACSRIGSHRISSVRAEISAIESALTSFKQRYGVEPPSHVTLHATEAGWDSDHVSRSRIRQIWPQFDFKTCGGLKDVPETGVHLNAGECLVFFLGGLVDPKSGEPGGFSKSPTRPLEAGGKRDYASFEFEGRIDPLTNRPAGRLCDIDRDGFPEYLDLFPGQTKPYLYISSYDGAGYDPADFDGAMQDVYRKTSEPDAEPWRPKSFQIISSGRDHEYGLGGYFDPHTAGQLRNHPRRKAECDNFTNFSSRELAATPKLVPGLEDQLGQVIGLVLLSLIMMCIVWLVVFRRT
jgi:hypothetical protein